ncbi:MAG: 3-methyl-2-oxobutanoate hydroxymethyltransferase [Rickettsiales bacterium]|nr:3-methyl-2-oxobutanoate hydroxymethyltransferase [Rickettsiales bacterium]
MLNSLLKDGAILTLKKRISIDKIKKKKTLVCLTAYTKPIATIADQFADILLVGDSLGPVIYGLDSTREVELDLMINHGKAVVKATKKSLIVVDMPYGTYELSKYKAYENASKIIDLTGANAVKLEGGIEIIKTIEYLIKKKINIMGHVGMLPQKLQENKTIRVYGKTQNEKIKIRKDIIALEKAGVFSIVIEATFLQVVNHAIQNIQIPIIGIGASNQCQGQILVTEDMIGMTNFNAKFLKKYSNLSKIIRHAIKEYSSQIRSGKFPSKKNMYE